MSEHVNQDIKYDQASAVPIRFRDRETEFCLITSSGKRRWGFPKGIIDPGETPTETALKEAEEEAGVTGEIRNPPLGTYEYHKWGRSLSVLVMLMEVHESLDAWEESWLRERRWLKIDQALQWLDPCRGLAYFVLEAARRLNGPVSSVRAAGKPGAGPVC
ncbi:MAG: NUDIX hydrolase [Planctomycetota bacterium]